MLPPSIRFRPCFLTIVIALLATVASATAGELLPGLTIRDDGTLLLSGLKMEVVVYDAKWGPVKQDALRRTEGFPKADGDSFQVEGVLPLKAGGEFRFTQSVGKGTNGIAYQAALAAPDGVEAKVLALCVDLPVAAYAGKALSAGGKELLLPAEFKSQDAGAAKELTELAIPLTEGALKISGKFDIYVQDLRQYKGQSFSVRIFFTPAGGLITEAALDLQISRQQ